VGDVQAAKVFLALVMGSRHIIATDLDIVGSLARQRLDARWRASTPNMSISPSIPRERHHGDAPASPLSLGSALCCIDQVGFGPG
jgi:hypothetical protein